MPYLIFQNHTGKNTIAVTDNGEFHFGRTNDNDITILDDPLVSRKHCVIFMDPLKNRFVLKDLNSSNGTLINGNTVSGDEAFISEGDKINVGNAEFIFSIENPERYQSTTTSIMKSGKTNLGADAIESRDTSKSNPAGQPAERKDSPIPPAKLDSSSAIPKEMEINGYKIVRTISLSEKATVYLAFQESVKRTVILKIFSSKSDSEAKASFKELVQKIGRLSHSKTPTHPSVIAFIGCPPFLVAKDLETVISFGIIHDCANAATAGKSHRV